MITTIGLIGAIASIIGLLITVKIIPEGTGKISALSLVVEKYFDDLITLRPGSVYINKQLDIRMIVSSFGGLNIRSEVFWSTIEFPATVYKNSGFFLFLNFKHQGDDFDFTYEGNYYRVILTKVVSEDVDYRNSNYSWGKQQPWLEKIIHGKNFCQIRIYEIPEKQMRRWYLGKD